MKAEECKCCICGRKAYAFWPYIDPDIPSNAYCEKHLREQQMKVITGVLGEEEGKRMYRKESKMKKYTITLTEEQMRLVAEGMEDYHRFLAGECRMVNATQYVQPAQDMHFLRDEMDRLAHPRMTPYVPYGGSYDWAGTHCPNDHQRKAIAMSYMIYREILHHFAMQRPKEIWNCLQSKTLICEEQGPLIKIEEVQ